MGLCGSRSRITPSAYCPNVLGQYTATPRDCPPVFQGRSDHPFVPVTGGDGHGVVDVEHLAEAPETERKIEVLAPVEVRKSARGFDGGDAEELGLVSVGNAKAAGSQPIPRFDRAEHQPPVGDAVAQRSRHRLRGRRDRRRQDLARAGETIMSAWMTRTQEARSRTAR